MKRVLVFLGLFVLLMSDLSAQLEKIQAAFIYNFAKYIEWPVSYRRGDFIIGVLGDVKLETELKKIARVKMIGTQKIKIEHVASADEIYDLHVLFVAKRRNKDLSKIYDVYKNMPILIITDGADFYYDINFVVVDGHLKYKVNPASIKTKGLKIKEKLIKLSVK